MSKNTAAFIQNEFIRLFFEEKKTLISEIKKMKQWVNKPAVCLSNCYYPHLKKGLN